jgi:hypothetical protein
MVAPSTRSDVIALSFMVQMSMGEVVSIPKRMIGETRASERENGTGYPTAAAAIVFIHHQVLPWEATNGKRRIQPSESCTGEAYTGYL